MFPGVKWCGLLSAGAIPGHAGRTSGPYQADGSIVSWRPTSEWAFRFPRRPLLTRSKAQKSAPGRQGTRRWRLNLASSASSHLIAGLLVTVACGGNQQKPAHVTDRLQLHTDLPGAARDQLKRSFAKYNKVPVRFISLPAPSRTAPPNPLSGVVMTRDAMPLVALDQRNKLAFLPGPILARVPGRLRAPNGTWVAVSARPRAVVYDHKGLGKIKPPQNLGDLGDPKWKTKLAWAPLSPGFLRQVASLIQTRGEDECIAWLRTLHEMQAMVHDTERQALEAVGRGQAALTFVDRNLVDRYIHSHGESTLRMLHFPELNPPVPSQLRAVAMLKDTEALRPARTFVDFLLTETAQSILERTLHEVSTSSTLDPAWLQDGLRANPRAIKFAQADIPRAKRVMENVLEGRGP